jgi:hypothetical protein
MVMFPLISGYQISKLRLAALVAQATSPFPRILGWWVRTLRAAGSNARSPVKKRAEVFTSTTMMMTSGRRRYMPTSD